MDPLRLAVLLVLIGEPVPDHLMGTARDALGRGFDSPTSKTLAERPVDEAQARPMVLRVAEEIGWEVPDPGAARVEVVRHWARQILTGAAAPVDGARQIARIGGGLEDGTEAGVFAALVAKRSDGEAGDECDRQILEQAGLLVSDTA